MNATTLAILGAALLGQAAGDAKPDPSLDYMKRKAAAYRFTLDGSKPLRLKEDPAFRMGKQPGDSVLEGAIFFWLGDDGRPEAAAQVFLSRYPDQQARWVHEFTSLSPRGFVGEVDGRPTWSPGRPGVEFRAIPGAPRPAATAAQRSAQFRSLAREFAVSDHFQGIKWEELRLLPTPVARYGKPGTAVEDGGLFAFVIGTDPEVFLFVEARPGPGGPEWQYAFAPMTCYQLKASHAGRVVWEIPYRGNPFDASQPYFAKSE